MCGLSLRFEFVKAMETLQGAALGLKLRELSDSARQRVWIASPYIGRWPAVSALLGANWWLSRTVLLRVITDIADPKNVNQGTLARLFDRGSVSSLKGVHAKIYIVDDRALVTSANLTETAFTKRREIGVLLEASESKDVIAIFDTWWREFASEVDPKTAERWQRNSAFGPEAEAEGLRTLWALPQRPADNLFDLTDTTARTFASYRKFLQHYQELAQEYEAIHRLWPTAPLFIEIDTFLNYLFHEAEGRPSFAMHESREPRKLSKAERLKELALWVPRFAVWLPTADETFRVQNARVVQSLLEKDHIESLTRDEIRQVADCLHCMNSQRLIKHKFLNPANNDIEDIQRAWKVLLHGKDKLEQRMQECDGILNFFGTSSVQELLGWFYPNTYPIRNSNSDAGLRFFGYRV